MKLIRTEEAVGHILCHDLTQIVKDVKKDAVFRKGHVVTKEDIPILLSIGKEHLYVWEKTEGMLHEDEGAEILRQITQGAGLAAGDPKEGRINLKAVKAGVLKVRRKELIAVNSLGEVMIATKRHNSFIEEGGIAAGMRVIPLVIAEKKLEEARAAAGNEPLCRILPIRQKKAAVIATGSEIYKGRIRDTFTPVVEEKLNRFGTDVIVKEVVDDDPLMATSAILSAIEAGAELVCCTGGMSVDPDDRTPLAIRNTGAEIVSYGAPVLPGAMFLLSYYEKKKEGGTIESIPIVGLPGCVMYAGTTVFDLILPRLLSDDKVLFSELAELGEGGLL